MEDLIDEILIDIKLSEGEIKNYSLLSLAFLGDSIHSFFVRTKLINAANFKVKQLHSSQTKFVKASSQKLALDGILSLLNEDELSIVKRAKNSKTNNIAKNSSISEYKSATAFESLLGYLALSKKNDRLKFILNKSYEIVESEIKQWEYMVRILV